MHAWLVPIVQAVSAREALRRGSGKKDSSLVIPGLRNRYYICLVCSRASSLRAGPPTSEKSVGSAASGSALNRFPTPLGPGLRLLPSWLGRARHGPASFEQEPADVRGLLDRATLPSLLLTGETAEWRAVV